MKITLWSIQAEEVWHQAIKSGVFLADPNYIDSFFLQPYSWIEKEMSKRIGPPGEGIIHPVWAWYNAGGYLKKPDLRKKGYLQAGKKGVRLTIEIDSEQVLLTDFENWHIILNTGDDESIEKESTILENDFIPIEEVESPWEVQGNNVVMQWEKIIQKPESKLPYIQATMWQVNLDQIKKVEYFKAR